MVAQAGTHQGLLAALRFTKADVLVLDLNLHSIPATSENGLTICKHVTDHFPPIKVVVLTASEKTADLSAAFSNGAGGYVLKSTNFDELVSAIKTVHHGGTYICTRMQAKLDNQL